MPDALEVEHGTPTLSPRAPPPTPKMPSSPMIPPVAELACAPVSSQALQAALATDATPAQQHLSQPLSPSPTPLRAPSPISRPAHPGPPTCGPCGALNTGRTAVNLRPLSASLPPSPPRTPRRNSEPLSTTEDDADNNATRVLDLPALRALAAAGTDLSHFPGVQITLASAPPSAGPEGSFYSGPSARVAARHTVIDRTVPGTANTVFGPDLAARLVTYLASEPLSPWLSPRASPSPPLALPLEVESGDGVKPECEGTARAPRTPPARAAARLGSPPGLPEAWWGGGPSLRAAAWAALSDIGDGEDAVRAGVEWGCGGSFVIVPSRTASSAAYATYAFSPPFDDASANTLRALVARTSPRRSARSPAPSPDTIRSAGAARSPSPSLSLGPPLELVPSWGGSPEWKSKIGLNGPAANADVSLNTPDPNVPAPSNALNLCGVSPQDCK